ncbi:MAG TPA: GNAT family N-acetyltransferase [Candidatus Omnitrophota bacterium]|nr:GNAT family N-acetyltransferase [Candidatus Omnitrophota bacterium]
MNEIKTLPLFEAFEKLALPEAERNLFSSLSWQRVIDKTYGLKLFCKYLQQDGKVLSYFIYSAVHNFLEWKICVGSYCDYLDCHVTDPRHWKLFFEAIRQEYPMYRIAIRNLKDETARQCGDFKLLSKEKHHEIDVRADLDELWKNTFRTFKVAYKKALGHLKFKRCTKEYLPKFYELHLKLRKNKYKIFPQPYRFFENIWEEYMEKDKGVLIGALDSRGRLLAAQIFLACGKGLFYKFSTSRQDVLHLKPNNLLMWEGIKYAKEKGLEKIDLGSSGLEQEGLIWFKRHICAPTLESDIYHLGFAPQGYKFSQKRILKVYTKFFTSPLMPDAMVRWGSNFIYPFLS